MAKTLTAANSVIMLSVAGLFPAPVRLQGFAADDVFSTDSVESSETVMGVDGKLSAGWVPVPIMQTYTLQADSDSVALFETWYAAQQTVRELYYATGLVRLPSLSRSYVLTKGVLKSLSPMAAAKKIMQPRAFSITWESLTGAPL